VVFAHNHVQLDREVVRFDTVIAQAQTARVQSSAAGFYTAPKFTGTGRRDAADRFTTLAMARPARKSRSTRSPVSTLSNVSTRFTTSAVP
jgi:hypothetical protein